MSSILSTYLRQIKALKEYLIESQNIVLMSRNDSLPNVDKLKSFFENPQKKIYDYNLAIITLYGILESYIENRIEDYLEQLSNICLKFEELPDKIKGRHSALSAELILNIDKKYDKYSDISKEDVIQKMSSCLDSDSKYKLNVVAYTHHTANFRKETIEESFSKVGIENIIHQIIKDEFFKAKYIELEGIEESDYEKQREDGLLNTLSEIVARRNQIAHGTISGDIISPELQMKYADFIIALVIAIDHVVEESIQKEKFQYCERVTLGEPIQVIDDRIVCLNSGNQTIRKGNLLWMTNRNGEYVRTGEILSIELDHKEVDEVSDESSIAIGMKVNCKVKENYIYGIYKSNMI